MNYRILICTVIIGLGAAFSALAFSFSEPTEIAPNGSFSAPILSSNVDQTRFGPLGLGGVIISDSGEYINRGNLLSSGDLTIANPANDSELCLKNGDDYQCITKWSEIYSPFVRLSPPTPESDTGTIYLNGRATFKGAAGSDYALYTAANEPGPAIATHGFNGVAATQSIVGVNSYGVLGIAAHNSSTTGRQAYGIYGWDSGNTNAYAGYFDGDVEISGNAQLCFFNSGGDVLGTCISDWPVAGPADDLLKLQTVFPFTYQSGIISVSGAARFTTVAIGNPAGHARDATCGDGACSAGSVPSETSATCPVDCPTVTEVDAEWLNPTTARFTWNSNTPMNSIVQYGASDQYGSQLRDDAEITAHSLEVSELTNEQSYQFRVGGQTSGSGIVLFSVNNVLYGIGDEQAPLAPALALEPYTSPVVHLPTLSDPSQYVYLTWAHTKEDLPPPPDGSGFSHFNIYRRIQDIGLPIYLGENTDAEYRDDTIEQGRVYEYSITAVDRNENESSSLVFDNIRIPTRCVSDSDCGSEYPYCCTGYDGYACTDVSCYDPDGGDGSPIMNKPPTSSPIMEKDTIDP